MFQIWSHSFQNGSTEESDSQHEAIEDMSDDDGTIITSNEFEVNRVPPKM